MHIINKTTEIGCQTPINCHYDGSGHIDLSLSVEVKMKMCVSTHKSACIVLIQYQLCIFNLFIKAWFDKSFSIVPIKISCV